MLLAQPYMACCLCHGNKHITEHKQIITTQPFHPINLKLLPFYLRQRHLTMSIGEFTVKSGSEVYRNHIKGLKNDAQLNAVINRHASQSYENTF